LRRHRHGGGRLHFFDSQAVTDLRSSLRGPLRERRAAIGAAQRIAAASAIAERLLQWSVVRDARHVAGYWAIGGELPLHVLMSRLPDSARYCLPVLQDDRTLRFAPWRVGDPVVPNRFGIPEPAQPCDPLDPAALDAVLLPLVGFTRGGARLGMGGGWYDRSFAFRRGTAAPPLLIGVAFACQQIDALDVQDWDVPLDALVTERELLVWTR
jgi:5-formyltetrahydrofolate cyclo-ligase